MASCQKCYYFKHPCVDYNYDILSYTINLFVNIGDILHEINIFAMYFSWLVFVKSNMAAPISREGLQPAAKLCDFSAFYLLDF